MANDLAVQDPTEKKQMKLSMPRWTKAQLELLKRTVAKGTTDDEFSLFAYTCRRTGLDPFIKQIYAIKRWDPETDSFKMGIQVGIDGYRLVAHRTGKLAGIDPAEFVDDPDEDWHPKTATVTVYAYDGQGEKRAYTHSVRWREYVQKKKDGTPVKMWSEKGMPYNQLAKCAEAGALRKAFPFDLSGILTHDEVPTIDIEVISSDGAGGSAADAPKQADTKSGDYYTGQLKAWAPKSATNKTHRFTFALDNNGGEISLTSFDTPPALKPIGDKAIGRRCQFQYEERPNPKGGTPFRNLTHVALEELTPEPEEPGKEPAPPTDGLPSVQGYLDLINSSPGTSMLMDVWGQVSKEIMTRDDISKADKGRLSKAYDDLLAKFKRS